MVAERGLLVSTQSSARCWACAATDLGTAVAAENAPPEPRPASPHVLSGSMKSSSISPQRLRVASTTRETPRPRRRISSWPTIRHLELERRKPICLAPIRLSKFKEATTQKAFVARISSRAKSNRKFLEQFGGADALAAGNFTLKWLTSRARGLRCFHRSELFASQKRV